MTLPRTVNKTATMQEGNVIHADFGKKPLSLGLHFDFEILYMSAEVVLVKVLTVIGGVASIDYVAVPLFMTPTTPAAA